MAELSNLIRKADEWLNLVDVPDYPQALNGLQLEGGSEVKKIVAAVDACFPIIDAACEADADLLVVHHGLFWQGAQKMEGALYRKLKRAMDHGLAIYSVHIPLDVHPEWGNNAGLMQALGIDSGVKPFFPWKGISLGLAADVSWSFEECLERAAKAVGGPVHSCPGGPSEVKRLGVITGGAGSEVFDVSATGIDTFITGEGPHWSYTAAEELGINLIYAGHYATETFGVKALAQKWCDEFSDLSWEFIDHPTGL
ncbi:MAG: Nif3-like dinuclear metal center hexameric protein [Verrucomicrobiota bacterium]